ncbi:MAG TPA: helix-turn-helix transcriptional regulator [Acidimicrobiales bacterium]|nr:helix-turn-helix transcriptional regulator [Acidimicrobiales bacterium]
MRGNHLIREVRRRAGLSQTELAERLGTTQSAIARIERHGSPTLARLSEVAQACGFDIHLRLVPFDAEEWGQVKANAELPAEERVRRSLGAIRLAEGFRQAGERRRRRVRAG